MPFRTLIRDPAVGIDVIAGGLAALPWTARRAALCTLSNADQGRLWHKAAASSPLGLNDLVATDVPDDTGVHHFGRNSLPLPEFLLRRFEKRFFRPSGVSDRLHGYNAGASEWLFGPGYFVVRKADDRPEWAERGAIVVDYFQVPERAPEGFPAVVPNTTLRQRFIFGGTRDFLRRVGAGVSIGAAYKGETSLGTYFLLLAPDQRSIG